MGRKVDPRKIITHRMPLDEAAHGYRIFNEKEDGCMKEGLVKKFLKFDR